MNDVLSSDVDMKPSKGKGGGGVDGVESLRHASSPQSGGQSTCCVTTLDDARQPAQPYFVLTEPMARPCFSDAAPDPPCIEGGERHPLRLSPG